MSFSAATVIGAAPMEVQFTDEVTTAGKVVVSWEWDFGDGDYSYEQNPVHVYYDSGVFSVSLVVVYSDASTDTFTITDYIIVDTTRLVANEVCLRYATEHGEGYGWSEYGGDDWVRPLDDWGVFTLNDDGDNQRTIVIDANDYEVYEIDGFDRIINTKPFPLDKQLVEDSEVDWKRRNTEDYSGEGYEHRYLKHECSYVHIRPQVPANKGSAGYTDSGQRTAQELSLNIYLNGDQLVPSGVINAFPEEGELVFSGRKTQCNRAATELCGTAGEIIIASMTDVYTSEGRAPSRERRVLTEHDIQKELSTGKVIHISRGRGTVIKNRANSEELSGGTVSRVTGPDGRSGSAISFDTDIDCGNDAILTNYTIIVWNKVGSLFTGVADYTQYSTSVSGYAMWYKKGNAGLGANLMLGAGNKFDIRVYSKQISDEAIASLYDDIKNFEGKMHLPGF